MIFCFYCTWGIVIKKGTKTQWSFREENHPLIFPLLFKHTNFPYFVLQLQLWSFHCLIKQNIEVFSNAKCFRIVVLLDEAKGLTNQLIATCKVVWDSLMKGAKKKKGYSYYELLKIHLLIVFSTFSLQIYFVFRSDKNSINNANKSTEK